MFRRTFFFSLAALILATPATAQRYGYQDAPQNRPDRDHSRRDDHGRGNQSDRRGSNDRGSNGRGDDGRNNGGRSDRTWRQQQPESRPPPPEQSSERAPPLERQRYQSQDRDQRPPDRPPERPPERPREVPLTDILRNLRGQYGGQHLDAQRSGANYVIPWLSRDGRRMTVVVDAATGRVISVR
jgi:hypothetical protein